MGNADSTEQNNNNQQPPLEYRQLLWGDVIYGTKDQLQSIGIAAGMPYPGESGGPKCTLNTIDSRGFSVKVEKSKWKGEDVYCASIRFPGRELKSERLWSSFADGVVKSEECSLFDEYIGTATALSAAGLVRVDELPGMPGMRKVRVTILPDGTLPLGSKTANCPKSREPGAKWIEKASKTTYRVCVNLPKDEEQRRQETNRLAELEWKSRMAALPRPAPLIEIKRGEGCMDTHYQYGDMYTDPEKHRDFLNTTSRIVETAFEDREFEYTAESTARINHAIFELRQAIACAVVAPTPLYQRAGNVLMADFRKGLNGSTVQ